MPLSDLQRERYHRHLLLPELGAAGQQRLLDARVLLVGMGGLGCPAALYLAAAGVGTLGLVDGDQVDRSNLQRQVLYVEDDLGAPKVERAARRLRALNPDLIVEPHFARLTRDNAATLIGAFDAVLDGTDDFAARYLVNDVCRRAGVPNVHGAVFRFEGQVAVFAGRAGPCYRCVFPAPPPAGAVPDCAAAGVLGVLPGLIGTLQATEAIKLIAGIGDPLVGRLLTYDALAMRFREFRLERRPDCPLCTGGPDAELPDFAPTCGAAAPAPLPGGEGEDPRTSAPVPELEPRVLAHRLRLGEEVLVLDVREPHEWALCHVEGALLIPLGELEARQGELAAWRAREIVCLCHHGMRSQRAAELLRRAGFARVANLKGGIDRWAEQVEPEMPRY